MKRVLAIGAVVLLTACGAAQTTPVLRTHAIVLRHPSVKAIAAARERAAAREVKALLRRFVPPPGASRRRPPRPYDGFDVSAVGGAVASDGVTVIRSRFWRTSLSYSEAVAWVESHVAAGFTGREEGGSTDDPPWTDYSYSQRSVRVINVAVAAYPTGVVIDVDASAAWIYPRSPQQVAPAATREVDIRSHKYSVHVTDPEKVRGIVRRFNALLLIRGHLDGWGCNELVTARPAPTVDFVFRSASGARLASASAPDWRSDGCDPIILRVGRTYTDLADRLSGPSFVSRVGSVVGVRLTPSR